MAGNSNNLDVELETLKLEQLELHLAYTFEDGINFKERIILINDDIDDEQYARVESAMTEMESYSRQPITIRINSDGGEEWAAQAIVGRMLRSKCKVITEGYGRIMSAATLIFAAGKLRRISKFAIFMWHESTYETSERHANTKSFIEFREQMEYLWASWMAGFSKKSKKFYYEEAKHTDKYWSPETLIEYGIADEII